MKKIKCPYNFDERNLKRIADLIDKTDKAEISSLFFAPFNGHMRTARLAGEYEPKSWDEYIKSVSAVKEAGFVPEVLLQEPGQLLTDEVIKMYLDIGVDRFSVYEDRNAKAIKRLEPDAYVCASLTKLLKPEDIEQLTDAYDEICLHFWYNREISVIEHLPKDRRYSILVNTSCSTQCRDCMVHWFGAESVREKFKCTGDKENYYGRIYDIEYFYDYIDIYKLQHRDCMDMAIIDLKMLIDYFENPRKKYDREYYDLKLEFPVFTKIG